MWKSIIEEYGKSAIQKLKIAKGALASIDSLKIIKKSHQTELPDILTYQRPNESARQGTDDDRHPIPEKILNEFADNYTKLELKFKQNKFVEIRKKLLGASIKEAVKVDYVWNETIHRAEWKNQAHYYLIKGNHNESDKYFWKVLWQNYNFAKTNDYNISIPHSTFQCCTDFHLCQLENIAIKVNPGRLWPRIHKVRKYLFRELLTDDQMWARYDKMFHKNDSIKII